MNYFLICPFETRRWRKPFFLFFKEDKRTAVNNKRKLLCQSWSQSQRDYEAIEFYFILFTFNYLCQIDACSAHSSFLQIKWVYKWRTRNSGEFGKLIKQIIKSDKLSVGWNKFVQWNVRHWRCRRTIQKCSVTLLQYWKTPSEQLWIDKLNNGDQLSWWTKLLCRPSVIVMQKVITWQATNIWEAFTLRSM